VFPVRYELNSYILFRRNSVFKGLRVKIHWKLCLGLSDIFIASQTVICKRMKQAEVMYRL
jgi:hypothetical protein